MKLAGSYCRLFVHDVHVRVRIREAMARAAFAAQASPRTAALARSSPVTHCSRASSCRVWPPAPTYRASSRARLSFDNGRSVG